MSSVRVLVGTRKGAFVLTSDGKRQDWSVSGPHFPGWEIYHVKGSPADPDRVFASQSSGWFGQVIQRSDDGGWTWEPVGNEFGSEGSPERTNGTMGHRIPGNSPGSGTWSPRSTIRRRSVPRRKMRACSARRMAANTGRNSPVCEAATPSRRGRREQVACACTPFCWTPPRAGGYSSPFRRPARSAPTMGARPGCRSTTACIPRESRTQAEVGHCVHRLALHPARPDVLYMQKHWDVMRSDDGGGSWLRSAAPVLRLRFSH